MGGFSVASSGSLYPLCHQLEACLGKLLPDLLDLGIVAGLKGQLEEAAGDGHIGVGAVVEDGHHVAAAAGDDVGHLLQLAGLILQRDGQVGLAAAHDEAAGDDAVEDVHVDVAAGDEADDLLALDGQLVEERRRHRHSSRALGHQLLVLHQGEDGRSGLVLGDGDDVVHILLAELVGQLTGGLDLNAVRKGGDGGEGLIFVLVEGAVHTGCTLGLHAVDLDLRLEALDGEGHAGDESAAAHRHDDGVHIGQLVEDLEADGALPGDDLLVIVGVDEGHARLFLQLDSLVVGIVIGAGHEADLRAEVLGVLHLHDGCAVRHTDDAPDAPAGSGQRHALRVVACRAGDDALVALLLGELADFIISAAHLEAAGHLQVLGLEVELAVLRELGGLDEVCLACYILEDKGGVVDLIQCQHIGFPILSLFIRPGTRGIFSSLKTGLSIVYII